MNNIVILGGLLITLATGIPVMMRMLRDHPRALIILFFAEMWERFSFFGMRTLLIFYLSQHFLFDDGRANAQFGSYATLVYLLPLIGGLVSDRILGARKAVAFGALLLVAGHFAMAIEGPAARQTLTYDGARYEFVTEGRGAEREVKLQVGNSLHDFAPTSGGGLSISDLPIGAPLPAQLAPGSFEMGVESGAAIFEHILYLALSLIAMGVGFLKGNISTLVSDLYPKADPRRDAGFMLYYFGINVGGFWAALLCGYLGQTYGWNWGFGLAGLGMLAGYLVFVLGRPLLVGRGEAPDPVRLSAPAAGPFNREQLTYIAALGGVVLVYLVMQHNAIVGWSLGLGSATILGYVFWWMATKATKVERDRLMLAMLLVAGAVVFWTLFLQGGTSLNLFADRNTNLALIEHPMIVNVFGQQLFFGTQAMLDAAGTAPNRWWIDMGFTAAQTQAFNSAFVLLLAPLFASFWTYLARRGRDPGSMIKFGLGLVQAGAGFLLIVWAQGYADESFRLPLIVLGLTYLLHTTGELCVSPVGLSELTRLSPAVLCSTMMAVWLLTSSAAQYVGAFIAGLSGTSTVGGQVLDPAESLRSATAVFQTIGWIGVGLGVLFLALHPLVKRWAHDDVPE